MKSSPNTICGIIADGAGSAQYGGQGAAIVCRSLAVHLRTYLAKYNGQFPTEEDLISWLESTRSHLSDLAASRNAKRQDFASTLIMLLISENQTLVVHIGDGAVVARDSAGSWNALSWPENGEYASSTYFVTDEPKPNLRVFVSKDAFNAFAIFSDGIEDLALNLTDKTPHQPFFSAMIKPLDDDNGKGKNHGLSSALGNFLDSAKVCEKTDDDKSLILLSSL